MQDRLQTIHHTLIKRSVIMFCWSVVSMLRQNFLLRQDRLKKDEEGLYLS